LILLVFNRWLTGLGLAYSTRKKALGILRSMFHWAARRRYTQPLNCAYWVPKAPEGSGRLHLPLSVTDLAAMMRCAGETDDHEVGAKRHSFLRARNLALLAVFIGTGARRAEVAGLAVEDVSLQSDYSGDLLLREAKEVRNRDVCQRLACFDRHTGRYLARWLAVRGRAARGSLWLADCGDPLTDQGIYKAIRGVAGAAGVRFGGLHDFRRTFITYFADKRPGEGHYHLLQLQIGHKPQGITHQLYDLRTIDSIRSVFCSPMEAVVPLLRD
jgi:integrase